jgi:ABC-2 type transport system ATP-binding protein
MFEMLELAELGGREKALEANLSSGYKQRLALAAAIIAGPELIFLDEPTSESVPPAAGSFLKLLSNWRKRVLP